MRIRKENARTHVDSVIIYNTGSGEPCDDFFKVFVVLRLREDLKIREEDLCIRAGEMVLPVHFEEYIEGSTSRITFSFSVPASLETEGRVLPLSYVYKAGTDEEFSRRIECHFLEFGDLFINHDDLEQICYPASVDTSSDRTSFLYQSVNNLLSFTSREVIRLDYPQEHVKLEKAYKRANSILGRSLHNKIVFYEKNCSRYEEGASIMFEKCIDEGITNARFILDFNSPDYDKVPEKYRRYLVDRYSMDHYLLAFGAKSMISSETITHLLGLNTCIGWVRHWLQKTPVRYAFLQHGVTYMTRIDRPGFGRGNGTALHAKYVVDSELEARHLEEYGNYRRENLIISGMPKFDRAYRNEGADKILIMPTWRGYEWNLIRTDLTASSYYRFIRKIIDAIPSEYRSRIVVKPHPLVAKFFAGDETLAEYYDDEHSHDELLRDTEVLITDYSSISYDAFFRGAKVIFDWEELDMTLKKGGFDLMLTENLAFGDIVWDTEGELGDAIRQSYGSGQSDIYISRYRQIVEFSDRKNSDRCFDALKAAGFFGFPKGGKVILKDSMIKGIQNKKYTGFPVRQQALEVVCKGNVLVPDLDYKVTYQDNTGPGTAYVHVQGVGRYAGTASCRFDIIKK